MKRMRLAISISLAHFLFIILSSFTQDGIDKRDADAMEIKIDRIIRSRRRTIALIIEPDGRLIVRAPYLVSEREIKKLVRSKQGWIARKRKEAQSQSLIRSRRSFADGERFWYLGATYPLKIVDELNPPLVLSQKFYLSRSALPHVGETFKEWYREQTRVEVIRRVNRLSKQHNLKYRRIRITSARTRWGSCSSSGNLNFTWRLVMAPPKVIDYVVAHEMAHLRVPNHSKAFWKQVHRIMPDYYDHKKWLKENGSQLAI
jgi:hypothetical protein